MNEMVNDQPVEKDSNIIRTFEQNISDLQTRISKIKEDIELKTAYTALKKNKNFNTVFNEHLFVKRIRNTWKDYNTAVINGFSDTETFKQTRLDMIKSIEFVKNIFDELDSDAYYLNLEKNLANFEKELADVNEKYLDYINE